MAKSTHSDRLERWLGTETVERISREFKDFYWPVAVNGVPGNVHVMPGGGFTGEIKAGQFMSSADGAALTLQKLAKRAEQKAVKDSSLDTLVQMIRAEDKRMYSVGAFASIDAVVAAFTGGKGQSHAFTKTGVAVTTIGQASSLWYSAGTAGAGATAAAAPGGTVPTSATTGALPYINGATTNSNRYLNWTLGASVINNSLLLYDRLFSVLKTASSSASESVTGVPTRYQNATSTAVDYIGGNFCTVEAASALGANAHNWNASTYTNQAGTASRAFQGSAGYTAACPIQGIDCSGGGTAATGSWFLPLATGDIGIRELDTMQCSVATVTGSAVFVIGHPIAINACPVANVACLDDGLYTALNLTPIMDGACLAFLELPKSATTATVYSGILRIVSE